MFVCMLVCMRLVFEVRFDSCEFNKQTLKVGREGRGGWVCIGLRL